jgi:hypothetical protein
MFLLGIPLLILSIYLLNLNGHSLLLKNFNKINSGEIVEKQIRAFLDIVDNRKYDRSSFGMLKGYIEIFEESCLNVDCSLKKYQQNLEENNIDTTSLLIQHAEYLYKRGISKFRYCISLRISYAYFLMDRMKKKQKANLEFSNAEKYNPDFEKEFIIYRFKKLIEENSSDESSSSVSLSDQDENLDVVSNIAYKNHFTKCKKKIINFLLLFLIINIFL